MKDRIDTKVSIIIPVYNVEAVLERTINSILQQEYRNFEVLLINDGSTDSSGKICDYFAAIDSRIRVFHKKMEEFLLQEMLDWRMLLENI